MLNIVGVKLRLVWGSVSLINEGSFSRTGSLLLAC